MLWTQTSSTLAPQAGAQSSMNQSAPLPEFDEYGTELRRDARVWKVYVEEADKYDKELVEGWKGSIDLILVFAALFSTISTAFLVESSKKLQEDPADVSAQTLLLIAQTLRELINSTEPSSTTTSALNDDDGFIPTRSAVTINTLWYLSLSLSLATAFISILAKDWCNSFLAGRTGHPYDQSQKRQRKWDMIERWGMPELLAVLPSLIHAALLFFAAGLCIYLWDMNAIVATPVICVSGVAICFYMWSSVMAISVDGFPYPTAISKAYRLIPRGLQIILLIPLNVSYYILRALKWIPRKIVDDPELSDLGLRIRLDWRDVVVFWAHLPLELPPVVIILLYDIFIFSPTAILDILLGTMIDKVESLRMKAYESSLWKWLADILPPKMTDDTEHADMTSLALSWLIKTCETPHSIDIALQSIAGANQGFDTEPLQECKASLLILQRLASGSSYKHLGPKTDTIVSLYSRALSFLGEHAGSGEGSAQSETGTNLEVMIWDLQVEAEKKVAESVTRGSFTPTKSNLDALRLGNTAASRSLRLWKGDHPSHHIDRDNIDEVLKSIDELLESYLNNPDFLHDAALLSLVHAASLLLLFIPNSPAAAALALPCVRLANSKRSSRPLISALASTCAVVCAKHPDQGQLNLAHGLAWTEQAVRALVKMHSKEAEALDTFSDYTLQELVTHQDVYHIEGLDSTMQNSLVKYNFSSGRGYRRVGGHPDLWDEDRLAHLQALEDVSDLTPASAPRPHAHLLVHEVMCRAWNPSSPSWDYCKQLISKCSFAKLSSRLTWVLDQREIIPLLAGVRASDIADPAARFFATGQLWLLFTLYLDSSEGKVDGRDQLLTQLRRFDEERLESEDNRRRHLGEEIDWLWNEEHQFISETLGVWAYRLMECVLESQNRELSEDLMQGLADVPQDLRGLAAFTRQQPQPIEPSATDSQPVEAEVSDGPDTTDRTPAAATEHATDGDHTADGEATATANEGREGEGVGQVDVNSGHVTTGEGGGTAVGGQADTEASNGEMSRSVGGDHGTTDGRQEIGGSMVVGGQGTGEQETGKGDEGQETRQEQNGIGEAERGSGSQPHISIDMSNWA